MVLITALVSLAAASHAVAELAGRFEEVGSTLVSGMMVSTTWAPLGDVTRRD
jgi:hypothetical protein